MEDSEALGFAEMGINWKRAVWGRWDILVLDMLGLKCLLHIQERCWKGSMSER